MSQRMHVMVPKMFVSLISWKVIDIGYDCAHILHYDYALLNKPFQVGVVYTPFIIRQMLNLIAPVSEIKAHQKIKLTQYMRT